MNTVDKHAVDQQKEKFSLIHLLTFHISISQSTGNSNQIFNLENLLNVY